MDDHYDRYNGMEELLSTNLAGVGTDCISRQAAIDAIGERERGMNPDAILGIILGLILGVHIGIAGTAIYVFWHNRRK